MGPRKTRTPRRVQVFFFEKKPQRTRTLVDEEGPDTDPDTQVDAPAVDVPDTDPFSQFGEVTETASPFEATVRMDALPVMDAAEGEPDEDAPPAVEANPGAQEVLEYHRLKLQALVRRGASKSEQALGDRALFAHALFARGRMREAQLVFESIVARDPDQAFPYTMLGAIFLAQQDGTRALALFDAALTMDPHDLAALVGRAEIRLRRGSPRLALKDLERALAEDPGGRLPFSRRARALANRARTLVRSAE